MRTPSADCRNQHLHHENPDQTVLAPCYGRQYGQAVASAGGGFQAIAETDVLFVHVNVHEAMQVFAAHQTCLDAGKLTFKMLDHFAYRSALGLDFLLTVR